MGEGNALSPTSVDEPQSQLDGEAARSAITDIRSRLSDGGWKAGAVLPLGLHSQIKPKLGSIPEKEGDRYLVVSQDCDILCHDLDVEPCAEVLCFRLIEKTNEERCHLRNPRVLQFPVQIEGEPKMAECWARDRGDILRTELLSVGPDSSIQVPPDALDELAQWMGRRYDRTAFPDAFNRRIEDRRKALRKFQERIGKDLVGIYVRVDPREELPDADSYKLIVRVVVKHSTGDSGERYKEIQQLYFPLINSLRSLDGIKLDDSALIFDDQFTLAMLADLDLIDFDFDLSFE